MVKMWQAKTNVGKFSQEITSNGEKCGWLKQMRPADEKHDSNKQWPNIYQPANDIYVA